MSAGDWKDMFLAACDGNVELVRYHLESGVDVDYAHPEFQSTALVGSILAGHEQVANLLLDHGADPLLVSPLEGQTPVEAARAAGLTGVEARLRAMGAAAPASGSASHRGRWPGRRRTGRR
jgi:ankyrin repeat protein